MRAALVPALALVALLAPLALAAAPPPGAETVSAGGGVRIASWVGEENATRSGDFAPGDVGRLWFAVAMEARSGNASGDANATNSTNSTNATWTLATFNVTSTDLAFLSPTLTLAPVNGSEWSLGSVQFRVPQNASTQQASYAWNGTVWRDDNGTLVPLATPSGGAAVSVVAPAPVPPPSGLPTSWLVGGAAVVLVAVGAGALAARSRAQRRKMRGQTRSQALREVELEERMEKRPEEAAVIREEIRQQEKVKEKRRDLQILEAKRADVLKTMDLLRKRHEAGALTKLQYDNMVAKKQVDLQRIEADIAQMEAEDAGGPGAAA